MTARTSVALTTGQYDRDTFTAPPLHDREAPRYGGSMAVMLLVLVLVRVVLLVWVVLLLRASHEVVVVVVAVAVGAPVVAGAGAVVATAAVVRAGRAGRCIVTRVCSVLFLVLFDGVNMFRWETVGSTTALALSFFLFFGFFVVG